MNKVMYLMNFDWEGFEKGEFCIKINNEDIVLMIDFETYVSCNTNITLIKNKYPGYILVFGSCLLAKNDIPVYILSDEIPPLTFLGRGSAFNTKEGNTAAYFKYGNNKKMFLIDCGSTVFSKIIENNVLDGVEELDVAITHLHPDHVGSLGDLIFYMYYKKNIKVNLYIPNIKIIGDYDLLKYLALQGIKSYMINIKTMSQRCDPFIVNFTRNIYHITDIESYFITIKNDMICNGKVPKRIHYTGDVRLLVTNHTVMFNNNKDIIEQVYIEACEPNKGCNVHLPINKLIDIIPVEYRSYYTIMHFDSDKTIQMARNAGFNIAGEKTKLEKKLKDAAISEKIKKYYGIVDTVNDCNICEYLKTASKMSNIKFPYLYKLKMHNVIDKKVIYDERCGWNTQAVYTIRYGEENYLEKYGSPQCIGMCTIIE